MSPLQRNSLLVVLLALLSYPLQAGALDAQGWFEKGNELSDEGRFQEAAEAYQKSIGQNPESPVGHYNLGIAYKNLKKYEQAVLSFKKTLELEPEYLDARLSLGNVYNLQERWEDAIGELNIVIHRRQGDAEAHGNLGWAYFNYQGTPSFKQLVIVNLKKAVELFAEQDLPEAAEATQKVLDEAMIRYGYGQSE